MKFFYSLLVMAATSTAFADVPLSYSVANTGAEYPDPVFPSAAQCPTISGLPNPFEFSDGSGVVESFCQWSQRRNEIKREIEHYEIGDIPAFESVDATYSGGTLTVTVKNGGKTLKLTAKISVPSGSGPHPVVIGMDGNTGSLSSSYFSKCIQVPFTHTQIAEYNSGLNNGGKSQSDPFFQFYPNSFHKGDYCAWSWGISRLIDGLEIVKDQINADLGHIAVTGCSYAGKMALFAGAFDERIALTIAQESGGGGINSWRVSEQIGSDVEGISNTNYDWFMSSFKTNFNGRTSKIPYDHHELIAMIAPRAFLAFGNPDYTWLGDKSGYISLKAAEEVWKAMGIDDRFGYVIEGGHNHCQASSRQNSAAQEFISKFLYGQESANTNIRTSTVTADADSWKKAWAGHKIDMSEVDCGIGGGTAEPDPEFSFDLDGLTALCAGSENEISWTMTGETSKSFKLMWNTGKNGEKIMPSTASASSEWTEGGSFKWAASNALTDDGKNGESSRWGALEGKDGFAGSWLQVNLSGSQVVAGVQIDEFEKYGAISEFEIQCDVDGKWQTVLEGTAIGKKYSASFPPVQTSKLRLYVKAAENVNINYLFPTGTSASELTNGITGSGSFKWKLKDDADETGILTICKSSGKVLASTDILQQKKCVNAGNESPNTAGSFTLVPNPTTGIFEVVSDEDIDCVEVVNSLSQVVFRADSRVVDVSVLPEGIYFVKVLTTAGCIGYEKLSLGK